MSELRVPLDAVTDAGGPEPKPSSATSPTPTFASSTPVTRLETQVAEIATVIGEFLPR
jgi:hypothetical protein